MPGPRGADVVICHCRAVNDQTIRATIVAGACGTDEVVRRCGAGGRCGGCLPALLALLEEFHLPHDSTATSAA